MSGLVALGVALFLPADLSATVEAMSGALEQPGGESLRLGPARPPHITLAQQFVSEDTLPAALNSIGDALVDVQPVSLDLLGGVLEDRTVWLVVERTPPLVALHGRLMAALQPFERACGTVAAFAGGDARPRDARWVEGFRAQASFTAFAPHVTLGHAPETPSLDPLTFTATTAAACHLGRFCTFGTVLRRWSLDGSGRGE